MSYPMSTEQRNEIRMKKGISKKKSCVVSVRERTIPTERDRHLSIKKMAVTAVAAPLVCAVSTHALSYHGSAVTEAEQRWGHTWRYICNCNWDFCDVSTARERWQMSTDLESKTVLERNYFQDLVLNWSRALKCSLKELGGGGVWVEIGFIWLEQ
jgi:hypothetical protein